MILNDKAIVIKITPFSVAIHPALTNTVVEATGKPNDQNEIGRQC